jgi:DNA (cytosine-5)-methyltransferase 1
VNYLSVCSGIEAATVAWHPLGWSPCAFAENEKFPSAVLAHHYPHVPNLGDMTKFKDWPDADVDVLVGGTPCQSFSVAGLRKGMADLRGNLALTYLAIADRYRPEWLLWENVPGVLSSSGGRDFGAFLGSLAELRYGFAYRVLDAQYVRVDGFGRAVPQRRRRVFVVGNSRDWQRAAAVLFERESLSWHSAPRREAGERVAPTISSRPTGGGGLGTDFDCDGGLIASTGNVAHCLNAGAMGRIDYETETMIAHALRGEGFDASEDGTGRGTPLAPIAFDCKASGRNGFAIGEISPTLTVPSKSGGGQPTAVAFQSSQSGVRLDDVHATLDSHNGSRRHNGVVTGWAVRRLTPRECERLQGFPDGYTDIPWRGKDHAPDGLRYKALGNSMAVNVMRWIGMRIQHVSDLAVDEAIGAHQ